ncbi:MAG: gliding motility-associated C-terminal domain-containing protein [Bacteroidota bacterium]
MNKTLLSISLSALFFLKNYLFLPCLLFLCLLQPAEAQSPCGTNPDPGSVAPGCFTIYASTDNGLTYSYPDVERICVGTKIKLIECPSTPTPIRNSVYLFDDKKPSEETSGPIPTHTYTEPGTYTILQRGSGDAPIFCIYLYKQIVVLPTPVPVFSLSTCYGNNVWLNIPSDNPNNVYDEYLVDWGDGVSEVISPAVAVNYKYKYTLAGAKTVTVTGRYKPVGCGNSATSTVTPVDVINRPALNKLVVNDTVSVDLFFTPTADYPTYDIQQRIPPGAYQSIQQLTNPPIGQPLHIDKLNTQTTTYCFKIVPSDACGAKYDEMGEVCTERLTAKAENNRNKITWLTYSVPGSPAYELYRDGTLLSSISPAISYYDKDIRCSQKYCYQLRVKAGTIESVALPVCVIAISDDKPTVLTDLTASVVNGKTVLTWQKPAKFAVRNYTIMRAVNGGAFENYSQIAANPVQFADYQQSNDTTHYCYRVSYTDSCGKVAEPTGIACPIWLKRVADPSSTDPYQLEWTAYDNWPAGVSAYVVEWLDEEGNIRKEVAAGNVLKYSEKELDTVQQVLYFRIKAISNDGLPLESYSNVIEYIQQLRIYLPDGFTPNQDGLNDTYVAQGVFIQKFRMQIFNRWGELIFFSDAIDKGWDGTYKGNSAPPSTYVCRIEATDFRGKTTKVNKVFTLIN